MDRSWQIRKVYEAQTGNEIWPQMTLMTQIKTTDQILSICIICVICG